MRGLFTTKKVRTFDSGPACLRSTQPQGLGLSFPLQWQILTESREGELRRLAAFENGVDPDLWGEKGTAEDVSHSAASRRVVKLPGGKETIQRENLLAQ